MRKAEEFRNMSMEDLHAELEDAAKELFLMRNEIGTTRKIEKPHLMKQKKKERARILTIIKEKQQQKNS
ncbi:MAG: hypothetical protein Tsb0015_03390 [Simkaniaceae bacterium]